MCYHRGQCILNRKAVQMVICGIVLLAIGIGTLLGLNIWPVVLIALGGAMLFSVLAGAGKRHREWFYTCVVGGRHSDKPRMSEIPRRIRAEQKPALLVSSDLPA